MHLAAQPANQRSVQHGPLVLVSEPRKFHTPTIDRDRTVSRLSLIHILRISADDEDDDDIAVELPEGDISEGPHEICLLYTSVTACLFHNEPTSCLRRQG